MWQTEKDPDRNFVVEEVLLWTKSDHTKQKQNWALVHAFRHPADENVWHRSVSYIETKNEALVPHTRLGYRPFAKPPSASDICAFLLHVRGLSLDSGFSHVAGDFPESTWRDLTGTSAPCSYSGKIKP